MDSPERENTRHGSPVLGSRRKRLLLLLLLSFCIVVSTGLGVWQIYRLSWKLELIANVDARAHGSPVSIPAVESWDALDMDELVYQRVTLSGEFDHAAEVQTLAVTELGSGYWVMTPLQLGDSGVVLINRGFVPQALKEPASRSGVLPSGIVNVTGLLRSSEPDGGFLRDNDPDNNRWFSRDTKAIAAAREQSEPVAPFFVDADAQSSATDQQYNLSDDAATYPRGGLTVITFRNTHLVYALTWFTLAAMGVFGIFLIVRENYRSR